MKTIPVLLIALMAGPALADATPQVWLSSTKMMALFQDREDASYIDSWRETARLIDGLKFWDGHISSASVETLRDVFAKCRELDLRIAYEKGRWPLPAELHPRQVTLQLERDRKSTPDAAREQAERYTVEDRGVPLESYDPEEFAEKAAQPMILRLRKIREAGGLDLLECIELDGAILKNVFPYCFARTQWRIPDIPESQAYQHGFESPDAFLTAFRLMAEKVYAAVPEAAHVRFRHLPNIHFWTYRQQVIPETTPDGTVVYHNVDFKRFQTETLDYHYVLLALIEHRDLFVGITTDYPHELYRRPAGNARYRGIAKEATDLGFSFAPIVTAMSGDESLCAYRTAVRAYFEQLQDQVAPDRYIIQSWELHPTFVEIVVSEDESGSFMSMVKQIAEKAAAGSH